MRATGMIRREFVRRIVQAGAGLAALAATRPARSAAGAKIRIGQIGTAHGHAEGKLATIRKMHGEYELVGVVEPDPARRQAVQGRGAYRDVRWMTEEELLNTPGLQAVAVETAVRDLVPTAARCVAAGVHVHLDKPAGASLEAFRRLLDEATRRRLVIQMGYMLRYNPGFRLCFQAVKEGWLGDVFEIYATMSKTIGPNQRRELAEYRGGAMFELGGHLIDPLVHILGRPRGIAPFARRTRPEQDDLADNQLAVFEYPEATAAIRVALVEVQGERRRQFVVCGDRGTLDIRPLEPPRLELTLAEPRGGFSKGAQGVDLPALGGRYDGDFLDLARIVRGEKSPDFGPQHDLTVHECLLKASGMM